MLYQKKMCVISSVSFSSLSMDNLFITKYNRMMFTPLEGYCLVSSHCHLIETWLCDAPFIFPPYIRL